MYKITVERLVMRLNREGTPLYALGYDGPKPTTTDKPHQANYWKVSQGAMPAFSHEFREAMAGRLEHARKWYPDARLEIVRLETSISVVEL